MRAAIQSIQIYQETLRPAIEAANLAQSALAGIKPILQWYENNNYAAVAARTISMSSAIQMASIVDSINIVQQNSAFNIIQDTFVSPAMKWLTSFDFNPIHTFLETFANSYKIDFNKDLYEKYYCEQMYLLRWFPYAGSVLNASYMSQVNEIWNHTKSGSKNRAKQTDKVVFSFYSKSEIESIRKSWAKLGLPRYLTRILNQAVQAYYRGEYAMTVCSLTTLWEGIICDKINDPSYRKSNKTKENLEKLVDENGYDEVFYSFCDEFIFYNCSSSKEVKDDVPGRHSTAHCWYDKYPTKKAALNAILFTDFLLNLRSV